MTRATPDASATALPAWVAFLAAGLCFVAAGFVATASGAVSDPGQPGPAALPTAAWQAPVALVGIGVVLLACARLTPAGVRSWRLLTYPTAVVAALLACGLCGAQVLQVQRLASTLRAAPYLEGAPLPLVPPQPLPTRPQQPPLPGDPLDLLPLLGDANPGRRQLVVDALLDLGPAAAPALQAAVRDPAFPARPLAAETLGLVLEQEPVPSAAGLTALLGALAPEQPQPLRWAASRALQGVHDLRCVGALVALLAPGRDEVRDAVEALTGNVFPNPQAASDWWSRRRWAFGPQLGVQPAQTVVVRADAGELIAALRADTPSVNPLLTERLAILGPAVVPRLTAALDAPGRREVRGELAGALARILAGQDEPERDPQALTALLRVAADPGAAGDQAARALAEVADPRTVAALIRALDAARSEHVHALEVLTGQTFATSADAERWWSTHRKGYPTQLLPAGLAQVTASDGRRLTRLPAGQVVYLEGWFAHDCADEACNHADVSVQLALADRELPLELLATSPQALTIRLPVDLPPGPCQLVVQVAGQPAGSLDFDAR